MGEERGCDHRSLREPDDGSMATALGFDFGDSTDESGSGDEGRILEGSSLEERVREIFVVEK